MNFQDLVQKIKEGFQDSKKLRVGHKEGPLFFGRDFGLLESFREEILGSKTKSWKTTERLIDQIIQGQIPDAICPDDDIKGVAEIRWCLLVGYLACFSAILRHRLSDDVTKMFRTAALSFDRSLPVKSELMIPRAGSVSREIVDDPKSNDTLKSLAEACGDGIVSGIGFWLAWDLFHMFAIDTGVHDKIDMRGTRNDGVISRVEVPVLFVDADSKGGYLNRLQVDVLRCQTSVLSPEPAWLGLTVLHHPQEPKCFHSSLQRIWSKIGSLFPGYRVRWELKGSADRKENKFLTSDISGRSLEASVAIALLSALRRATARDNEEKDQWELDPHVVVSATIDFRQPAEVDDLRLSPIKGADEKISAVIQADGEIEKNPNLIDTIIFANQQNVDELADRFRPNVTLIKCATFGELMNRARQDWSYVRHYKLSSAQDFWLNRKSELEIVDMFSKQGV